MKYRHIDSLIGREALVAARIERSWLWYRISVLAVTGTAATGDLDGYPVAITYAFTREGAYRQARRILGAR